MSDTKFHVSDYCARMLRVMPRGKEGTVLAGLELERRAPLDPSAESRVHAAIAETLKPALAANVDVQRFVLLRRKKAAFDKQKRDGELQIQMLTAQRERLILAASAEGQAARLQQIEAQIRSTGHAVTAAGGMCRALDIELAKAKAAAERALHQMLGQERPAALQRAQEARDAALAELCEIAGPTLDRLAAALQELKAAALPIERQKAHFARRLDRLELPADAPTDAAALPEPPAPPASKTAEEALRAATGGVLSVAAGQTVTLQR